MEVEAGLAKHEVGDVAAGHLEVGVGLQHQVIADIHAIAGEVERGLRRVESIHENKTWPPFTT